jgi:hypothetical protein
MVNQLFTIAVFSETFKPISGDKFSASQKIRQKNKIP